MGKKQEDIPSPFFIQICEILEKKANYSDLKNHKYFWGDLGFVLDEHKKGILLSFEINMESRTSTSEVSLLEHKLEDYIENKLYYKTSFHKRFLEKRAEVIGTEINLKEIYQIFKNPRRKQKQPRVLLFPVKKKEITLEQAELFIPHAIYPIHQLHVGGQQFIDEIERDIRNIKVTRRSKYRQSS